MSEVTSDGYNRGPMTIGMLPDDVLLKIFAFYVDRTWPKDGWYPIVHVCRKWRNIVLQSPNHLNLQLIHTEKTSMKKILEVWPPLPIIIEGDFYSKPGRDNLVATLKHSDRIREIKVWFISSMLWERILAEMQVPFPTLKHLDFWFTDPTPQVIPDSFLGASAPLLRKLELKGASFLGVPKLLLSAPDLVELSLRNIPHSGYISPAVMVACLSTLTRLKVFDLSFQSPQSTPDSERQHLPIPTRTVLYALTEFCFDGTSDYLEDFVARIDVPLLNCLVIEFFHQARFNCLQLAQFIGRIPHLRACDEARVLFSDDTVSITLPGPFEDQGLDLQVRCGQLDLQLAFVAQACNSSFPQALITTVERLYIWYWPDDQPDNTENSIWLMLLRPFINVKGLYLSGNLVPSTAAILQELAGETETDVLPALQLLNVEEIHQKFFEPFIAARQLFGHTITISHWNGEG